MLGSIFIIVSLTVEIAIYVGLKSANSGLFYTPLYVEGKVEQLWKKGEVDEDGFFTLMSKSQQPKVITALSARDLEIKGNIFNNSEIIIC